MAVRVRPKSTCVTCGAPTAGCAAACHPCAMTAYHAGRVDTRRVREELTTLYDRGHDPDFERRVRELDRVVIR